MTYITQKSKQGLFFDYCFDKNRLKKWISKIYDETIATEDVTIIRFIEELKTFGFNEATKAGISIGIDDLKIPPKKRELLKLVEVETQNANDRVQSKTITPLENFQLTIDLWHKTNETIKAEVVSNFESTDTLNPVYMMAFSGARGNLSQVTQLLGMRGFMSDPEGQIIDFPIRSNFREGLTLTEYIISCYGARKGLVDTALRTADAGYLTRRLVDVAHSLVITIYDCNPQNSTWLTAIKENNKVIYPLEARLVGRVLADDVFINYFDTEKNTLIKKPWPYFKKYKQLNQLDAKLLGSCFKLVNVRSPLSCSHTYALCQLCYGWTLPHSHLAPLGEAVGIIAAQSIGEPGTQLTMRTFHTGGVFSGVLSDEILAPYSGTIQYDRPVIGAMFRLANGNLGFLTRETSKIKIIPFDKNIINQSIFEMVLPEDSILFLKQNETVKKNQLLLELPKEKDDDDNETLLNEYTYYSKTSGLVKLEETVIAPDHIFYPSKLYKHRRFKRRPRNVLRGTTDALEKRKVKLIRKNKVIYVYYPMQEQNQKYNSVKIYQGEICYASTVKTLPKVGDIVNRNSLVAITELNHTIDSELARIKETKISPKNKIFKNHNLKNLNLKIHKTIFNFNFGNVYFKAKCGYITSKKNLTPFSVTIQTLKTQPKNAPLKLNLLANNFATKTYGKVFWSKYEINPNITWSKYDTTIEYLSNPIFWLSEPIIKDYSHFKKLRISSKRIVAKSLNKTSHFLLSQKRGMCFENQKLLVEKVIRKKKLIWVKKNEIFSLQKTEQGFIQPNEAKSDGLVTWKLQRISLNLNKKKKKKKKVTNVIILKKIKTGWPYLSFDFCLTNKPQQKFFTIGEKLFHDIYSEQNNFICEYYSTKNMKFKSSKACITKLKTKQNLFVRNSKSRNYIDNKYCDNLNYLILIRKPVEFNFSTLNQNSEKFQSNWYQNAALRLLRKYQYLTKLNFAKSQIFFLIKLFNQLNRQSTLLSKVFQIETLICRFEKNVFIINPQNLNAKSLVTKHQFIQNQNSISPTVLAHLTILVRPNTYFCNTQELFQSKGIYNQSYQAGLFEIINEDPFFIKQLNTPNQYYVAQENLLIPQYAPIITNFFLSNYSGEIFNNSTSKYVNLHREFQLRQKLKLKSSPGSTVLTSSNSFTIQLSPKDRKCQIGQEIFRGLNLGKQTTALINGEIIYLTKNAIKCQKIDKFIMSTNSKFFCQTNQLILKNTRLYKDFYPRLQMGDIVQGIPKIEEFFEARRSKKGLPFEGNLHNRLKDRFKFYSGIYPLPIADRRSINDIQTYIIGSIFKLYSSQGINISDKHLELIVRQMTAKVHVTDYSSGGWGFEDTVMDLQPIIHEYYPRYIIEEVYWKLFKDRSNHQHGIFPYIFHYEPVILGITEASLDSFGFISAASFQETTRILTESSLFQTTDYLKGLKENVVLGHLIPAGTALQTRLATRRRKIRFTPEEFKTKLSRLLINRYVVDLSFKYNELPNSCRYLYKKPYKFINPILYLYLYTYCVYYSQPRIL